MLHNMSVRPTTQVDWTILPAGEAIVLFDLAGLGTELAEWPHGQAVLEILKGSPGRGSTASKAQQELASDLDEAWHECALHGAIHVYPFPAAGVAARAAGLPILRATHPALVANVLARTRSQLLLPSMPLALEAPFLTRELASDDPRLVELAARTAFVEEIER